MKMPVVTAVLAAGVAALSAGEQAGARAAGWGGGPSELGGVFLVLLKKGPKSGTGDSPERKAIQEGHMANIRAMWQARKLVIAGPLGDDGDLRRIFVVRVPQLEDA